MTIGTGADGGGGVTPAGPTEVQITSGLEVIAAQPLWKTKEQFIAEFAKTAFCWQSASTTTDAISEFNKAFRNACIAWNMLPDDYRQALIVEGGNFGKVKISEIKL